MCLSPGGQEGVKKVKKLSSKKGRAELKKEMYDAAVESVTEAVTEAVMDKVPRPIRARTLPPTAAA